MGQQPNIELDMADLPRPKAHPAPARRWNPNRPGDATGPADVPIGGAFGTTGPDPGYALKLVRSRHLDTALAESMHNARAAVASVAGARAALHGRAPTMEDVDVAILLLGYDRSAALDEVIDDLAERRASMVAGIAYSARKVTALIAGVPQALLLADVAGARAALAAGTLTLVS